MDVGGTGRCQAKTDWGGRKGRVHDALAVVVRPTLATEVRVSPLRVSPPVLTTYVCCLGLIQADPLSSGRGPAPVDTVTVSRVAEKVVVHSFGGPKSPDLRSRTEDGRPHRVRVRDEKQVGDGKEGRRSGFRKTVSFPWTLRLSICLSVPTDVKSRPIRDGPKRAAAGPLLRFTNTINSEVLMLVGRNPRTLLVSDVGLGNFTGHR